MVFSSLLFLFRFLPLVLLLYVAVPVRFRNLVLLLTSLVFYAWGEPVYVFLMLLSILVSYMGGILIDHFRAVERQALIREMKWGAEGREKAERGQEKGRSFRNYAGSSGRGSGRGSRKEKEAEKEPGPPGGRGSKLSLIFSVGILLLFLGYFKYTDFLIRTLNSLFDSEIPLLSLTLPIGISFYTFQTISYLVDIYRGNALVQRNIISYGAYVTMFPQLIAGPIVQYKTIDRALRMRVETPEEFAEGVVRFVTGLGKKVLLANNAGLLWDQIRVLDPGSLPLLSAWIGILAFTFQIYFDFSGYSDMAIGLGHMFGFRFLENFDHPYLSRSITEFWRRWHISLGTWFREYVYIPLGGNRAGNGKLIRNTLIVWLLTGIWHGADWNFMIWGIYYGILLLLEKLIWGSALKRLPRIFQHLYSMFFIMIGWYIFSFNEIDGKLGYLGAMFGRSGSFVSGGSLYLLYSNAALLLALILMSTNLPGRLWKKILTNLSGSVFLTVLVRGTAISLVLLLSVAFLVGASYNPFLYFRF